MGRGHWALQRPGKWLSSYLLLPQWSALVTWPLPHSRTRKYSVDDIRKVSQVTVAVTYRYLDEPVEFRSSSFSSWEDGSDPYWKKETIKDADAILKTTGYSDRYEHKAEGVELVRSHISREIL